MPFLRAIFCLAVGPFPVAAHAAPVSWGAIQTLTGSTNIVSTGVTSLAGANFGVTTGTTTIVNNGVGEAGGVNVEFKSLGSGQNATLANGLTVAADSQWRNWGFASGNSAVTGNFGTVLDSNLGIELNDPVSLSATITLSGLTIGTRYQVQFFADSTGNNSQTISGGEAMNTLSGRFVTGTFTADAASQALTVTRASGSTQFAVANALTIGVLAGDTTAPTWAATWPKVNQLSPTSLLVRARTNEAGTAHYVVLADGATAPSAVQVRAGMDSTNSAALKSGSVPLAANTETTGQVTGLTTDTSYTVHFIAEDTVPNLQAAPSGVSVSLTSMTREPFISEFVAVGGTLQDEDLDFPDWIEIYNPNGSAIDLAGYYLTDDAANLTKWVFPSTTLAAGGCLVVFASDKNRAVSGSALHTNFKLAASGEYLALVRPDGTTVVSEFSPTFPGQIDGYSYGIDGLASTGPQAYFTTPTPGAMNGTPGTPLVAPILDPPCAAFTTTTTVNITIAS